MHSIRTRHAVVALAAAVVLPLSLGAARHLPSGTTLRRAPAAPGATTGPVGPGCSSLPRSGAGSAQGMARQRLATATATNPQLTTLAAAAKRAGLTATWNAPGDSTLFAPTNAAFEKVPAGQLARLLNDRAQLRKVLAYHVVGRRITPSQLPHGSFVTREGSKLTTSGSGQSFKVNGTAGVVCGDIRTANGTVYLVDRLLTPPH